MEELSLSGLTDELIKDADKVLWRKNMKSMGLISEVFKLYYLATEEDICGTRIPVINSPFFTKIDPSEVLASTLTFVIEKELIHLLIHSIFQTLT